MKKHFILFLFSLFPLLAFGQWTRDAVKVDAFRLQTDVNPSISSLSDSMYTIHNWYGVEGYDISFAKTMIGDSTAITIVNPDRAGNGYFWVKTGIKELPYATVYPGMFEESNTICSGFFGNQEKGKVWAYVYLYDQDRHWKGGHLYQMYWGEGPEKPLWTAEGKSTLVGNIPEISSRLEAYSHNRYILRDWYGVEKYDLEFRVKEDGGIEILDYYWTENEERQVQCRRDDIAFASIPQGAVPNGGLKGNSKHGKLHFRMTAYEDDDKPIADRKHQEFIFKW